MAIARRMAFVCMLACFFTLLVMGCGGGPAPRDGGPDDGDAEDAGDGGGDLEDASDGGGDEVDAGDGGGDLEDASDGDGDEVDAGDDGGDLEDAGDGGGDVEDAGDGGGDLSDAGDDDEVQGVVPALSQVEPALICNGLDSSVLNLSGSDFLVLDDGAGGWNLPQLSIGLYNLQVDAPDPSDSSNCAPFSEGEYSGHLCQRLSAHLPAGQPPAGVHPVVVTNPAPLNGASMEYVTLQVLDPPRVENLTPAGLCAEATVTEARVQGSGFVVLGSSLASPDAAPQVALGAAGTAPILDIPAGQCQALSNAAGFVCGELLVDLSPFWQGPGNFSAFGEPVSVQNPATPGADEACVSASASAPAIAELPPPSITAVGPQPLCDDGSQTQLTVQGTGFQAGASLSLSGTITGPVTVLGVDDSGVDPDADPDLIVLTLSAPLAADIYSLGLLNPDGCSSAQNLEFAVEQAPRLLGIGPWMVFRQINTRVTLYFLPGSGTTSSLQLTQQGVAVPLVLDLNFVANSDEPNLLRADIPGAVEDLPVGEYAIRVTESTGCEAALADFWLAGSPGLAVDAVDPPFVAQGQRAAVIISGDGFADLPRIYLSRVNAGAADLAIPLTGVAFDDAQTLRAVVPAVDPAGNPLPAGEYDLVVVNPDGSVGLGSGVSVDDDQGLFRVSAQPAPRVDRVAPLRIALNAFGQLLDIRGAHFLNPEVSYLCIDAAGAPRAAIEVPQGQLTIHSEFYLSAPSPSDLSWTLQTGDVCLVRVRNTVEDTWGDFSSLAVGSSAGNIFSIFPGPPMQENRRAPAVELGADGAGGRFLYALGGDLGQASSAQSSAERAALDAYGHPQDFSILSSTRWQRADESEPALPEARTRAQVEALGPYLYLVGGNDGSGPVDTVLRARILDPDQAPVFAPWRAFLNLDAEGGLDTGLAPGVWRYRVSALFDQSDPVDPGGESLPSPSLVYRAPDLNPDDDGSANMQNGLLLQLGWAHVDRAIGYRIYRSPAPDASSGSEVWLTDVFLADVLTPSEWAALLPGDPLRLFVDDGQGIGNPDIQPLRPGALGVWHLFEILPGGQGLESSAVAVAADPCNAPIADPTVFEAECGSTVNTAPIHYLYVAGGRDAGGTVHDAVSVLRIDETADGEQISGGWLTPTPALNLPSERFEAGAFLVSSRFHNLVEDWESWIYFGVGRNQSGINNGEDMLAGRVLQGGSLGGQTTPNGPVPTRVAYGHAAAGNYLYVFGGDSGGSLRDDGVECEIAGPPGLFSWNNLSGGVSLGLARALPGSAQGASFIFLVGGEVWPPCSNTCSSINGLCEDGRPDAVDDSCAPGSDCTDCGDAPFATRTTELSHY